MVTGGETTATRTGVCTLHDMLWRWTVATEMSDGLAVVEWMPHPARPDYDRPFYGLSAFVDGHPTDALCQCEHPRASHAEHCAKASAEIARRAETPCFTTNRAAADPRRTHADPAVEVLTLAARGESVPRVLVAELARAAFSVGVSADVIARAMLPAPTQARAVVMLAVAVTATADAARAAGGV